MHQSALMMYCSALLMTYNEQLITYNKRRIGYSGVLITEISQETPIWVLLLIVHLLFNFSKVAL